ncbi:hypothetical protein AVEN_142583-1 [Araneus ventricosus]|uniref:Uncharacterized protein n=1 Tax=Araneus ventricosus TaxID=182803 RepID=A0A4Y2CG23_ARAVE|nr:hypothetical protein AVEN_142583-1 [Araneus ventricosus]
MISGALTNEAERNTHRILQRLYHKFSRHHLKFKFQETATVQGTLTLWKIYVLDRSLIVSSFAALITYGILIGSLGKKEDALKRYQTHQAHLCRIYVRSEADSVERKLHQRLVTLRHSFVCVQILSAKTAKR